MDDINDDEIEEELEGANDSLNLHDAAALERLPQLTSTPDERRQEVESPVTYSQDMHVLETTDVRASTSRTKESQSGLAANPDQLKKNKHAEMSNVSSLTPNIKEKESNKKNKKYRSEPENPAEDLVVLSFSSSAGQYQ